MSNELDLSDAAVDRFGPRATEAISFGPFTIGFDDTVLRPRPWTIEQAEWAAESATVPGPVAELCAGVGHIGLALAWLTSRDLVLLDSDPTACAFARANAQMSSLQLEIAVRNATIDKGLRADERFAVIVADPPWVPSSQLARFPEDPRIAIDGGTDGLDLARLCVDTIGRHLAPEGVAVLQVGTRTQVDLIRAYTEADPGGVEVVDVRVPSGNGMLVQLRRT